MVLSVEGHLVVGTGADEPETLAAVGLDLKLEFQTEGLGGAFPHAGEAKSARYPLVNVVDGQLGAVRLDARERVVKGASVRGEVPRRHYDDTAALLADHGKGTAILNSCRQRASG